MHTKEEYFTEIRDTGGISDSISGDEKDNITTGGEAVTVGAEDNISGLIVDEFDTEIPIMKRNVRPVPVPKKIEPRVIESRPEKKPEIRKEDNFTIRFSSDVRKRIPKGFNIEDIGRIDLLEAEKISNEGLLLLTESDLINELEDLNLDALMEAPLSHPAPESPLEKIEVTLLSDETAGPLSDETLLSDDDTEAEEPEWEESADEESMDLPEEPLIIPEEKAETGEVEAEANAGPGAGAGNNNEAEEMAAVKTEDVPEAKIGIGESEVTISEETVAANHDDPPELKIAIDESGNPESDIEDIEAWQPLEKEVRPEPATEEPQTQDGNSEVYSAMVRDVIPEEIRKIEDINSTVSFIDDELVDRGEEEKTSIFEENQLESIKLRLNEIMDTPVKIYEESDIDDDQNRIPHSSMVLPEYDESLELEFETDDYRFRDDELDFVDSSVFEEDYAKYIRNIDDLYGIRKRKEITRAVEILGLNESEIEFIEDRLYHDDYEGVNLDEIFSLIRFYGPGSKEADLLERYCNYLLPDSASLFDDEKRSIEEDVSSRGALIFEENVRDIERKLGREVEVDETPVVTVSEKVSDITDRIVIIEDEFDVDRFVKEFPDEKQPDLKKLLKYLDGLFEKLPEDVVRNFADSEYFDIYVNVLNEIGI
jgi:hypothetical protein